MPTTDENGRYPYPETGWASGFIKKAGASTGQIAPGNIEIPPNQNMKSYRIEDNGTHILIPSVHDEQLLSKDEATDLYRKTGKHFGIFENQEYADKYAAKLRTKGYGEYLPETTASTNIEDRRADTPWWKGSTAVQRAQLLESQSKRTRGGWDYVFGKRDDEEER
jgi:hypothetical protein